MRKSWLVTKRVTKVETWHLIVKADCKEEAEATMSDSDCEWCNTHGYISPDDTETIKEEISAVDATEKDCEMFNQLVDE